MNMPPETAESRGMPGALMARPLEREQIAQAFPLLQLTQPELTLAAWRRYAATLLGRAGSASQVTRRGIMTVQNRRGYIQGVFCYRIEKSLAYDRQIVVEGLSALDIVPGQQAGLVLGRALTMLARDLTCGAVYIHLPAGVLQHGQPRWLSDFLTATQAVQDQATYHVAEAIGV